MEHIYKVFFALLRTALTGESSEAELSVDEWTEVFRMSAQQSLTGVIWAAVSEKRLPMELAMRWATEAETIRGLNKLMNEESALLTKRFSEQGRRSAILKGQANARLYPDPSLRQPGDIDIWVEGGKDSVFALLIDMGLMNKATTATFEASTKASYHHVHLPTNEKGVMVAVHFRPSSGNANPLTNRRMQRWLEKEILSASLVDEGFCVPSVQFALVMQLAHIQKHFLKVGIGLRHICDYYCLLHNASADDLLQVEKLLNKFGLRHIAGALMWVLREVLHLDERQMLCQPDSCRGEWLLREIMEGGNFGRAFESRKFSLAKRLFAGRLRNLKLMRFDFWEVLWQQMDLGRWLLKTLSTRIKYRTLFLKGTP